MGVNIIKIDQEQRLEFAHENIAGFLLPETGHASASVGIIPPRGAQRHHKQQRPDGGVENIFIFRGTFTVEPPMSALERHNCEIDGPVFVQVPSDTPFSIRNLADQPVWFYTVFAPPFRPGEIEFLGDGG